MLQQVLTELALLLLDEVAYCLRVVGVLLAHTCKV